MDEWDDFNGVTFGDDSPEDERYIALACEHILNYLANDLFNILAEEDTVKHYGLYFEYVLLYLISFLLSFFLSFSLSLSPYLSTYLSIVLSPASHFPLSHTLTVRTPPTHSMEPISLLDVGQNILEDPDHYIPLLNTAISDAQMKLLEACDEEDRARFTHKTYVHARLRNLPHLGDTYIKDTVSSLRVTDRGRLLGLTGTVIRSGVIQMLDSEKQFECEKCGHQFTVKADIQNGSRIDIPRICPSSSTSTSKKSCKSYEFNFIEGTRVCRDYQELKLQEQVQKLKMGSIPRSILVVVQDDLVDVCVAGDDVVMIGVVRLMWRPMGKDQRVDLELFIDAVGVQILNDKKSSHLVSPELKYMYQDFWKAHANTPLRARNYIVSSICPQMYGLYLIKLAVALTVIGGVRRLAPDGSRTRGESHLLIVGDPGTGKSQLMRYAARMSPRSVMTTGIGTTSAGLTVTAVKDNGEWMLEAGALVLADGGICCIDEFGCIRTADRATIHEAMEQQTLSVAKAGLVCTLNTRCTIFAVTNPKGTYDPDVELSVNTAIATPLLSRFDIILLMLDSQNEEWDRNVANHIMNNLTKGGDEHDEMRREGEGEERERERGRGGDSMNKANSEVRDGDMDVHSQNAMNSEGGWNLETMRAYVQYVKMTFQPKITAFSQEILAKYYQLQRNTDSKSAARTTVRMLESLVRLAQGRLLWW